MQSPIPSGIYILMRKNPVMDEAVKADGKSEGDLARLVEILCRLRAPEGGCPWDIRQEKKDICRYVIEEAYELVESIDRGDPAHQQEELGDLLFQILFLIRLAEEKDEFTLSDVFTGIAEKMIRRHPHVFGDVKVATVGEVKANWDRIKRDVEQKKPVKGLFSGIPRALPALMRAHKIGSKAAGVGFDWPDTAGVVAKLEEEIGELKQALQQGTKEKIGEEIGDVLFTLVNLSRFTDVNAEEALRACNEKFIRRFSFIEEKLQSEGRSVGAANLEEMDRLWEEAKKIENSKQ